MLLRIMSRQVNIKASKVCVAIAAVLKTEGYIEDFDKIEDGYAGDIADYAEIRPDGPFGY